MKLVNQYNSVQREITNITMAKENTDGTLKEFRIRLALTSAADARATRELEARIERINRIAANIDITLSSYKRKLRIIGRRIIILQMQIEINRSSFE